MISVYLDVWEEDMKTEETRLAEEIVGVLPQAMARVCSDDRESIRFVVRAAGLRLRLVTLSRAALRRLVTDPLRRVKIEYLQRDLIRTAPKRDEFVYPRRNRINPPALELRPAKAV